VNLALDQVTMQFLCGAGLEADIHLAPLSDSNASTSFSHDYLGIIACFPLILNRQIASV
jgi:hypothetical protein